MHISYLPETLAQAMSNQFQTDKKIVDLAHCLEDSFDFARDVTTLPNKTRVLEPQMIKLLEKTSESCHFLQEYMHRGFLGATQLFYSIYGSNIHSRENA